MTKHVLLVISHQDRALREAIELTLEGTPGAEGAPAIDVETAKDEERAVLKLRERAFDYIVVGLALARNSKSMVDEYGGLEFCKAARRMTAAPIALLAPELNNAIQIRARDIPKLVPLKVSPSIGQDLVGLVEEAEPPLKRLDVIVYAKEGSDWEYELHGVGFSYTKAGSLRIMNALLTSWRSVAETLSKIDVDWYAPFHALGQSIIEAFCDVNEQFRHQLRVGLELAGGFAHSRVTFVVARAHYHIVLEAIRLPADEVPEPWMIHAPLMRNVAGSGIASANLFDVSQHPLSCLIIAADTHGAVDEITDARGDVLELPQLPLVAAESHAVNRMLDRAAGRPELGNTRVLRITQDEPLSKKRLLRELRERWDIVHFAGHSYYDESRSERGYLFVGASERPEPVEIGEVAPYLRGSKLVYLSSCQSTNATFAVEAAKACIPAVMGFRWRVEDRLAALHARVFYRRLFTCRSIDTAFWGTRRALHHRFPESNAWASSMLVMGQS